MSHFFQPHPAVSLHLSTTNFCLSPFNCVLMNKRRRRRSSDNLGRGRTFLPENMNKMLNFYIIFARNMSEFYMLIARRNIFPIFFLGGGGTCPLLPSPPTPMYKRCIPSKNLEEQKGNSVEYYVKQEIL